MAVWDDLVGQERLSAQLDAAARDADGIVTAAEKGIAPPEASKMTHAWLFTGPPGSGRVTAARAFARRCSVSVRTGRSAGARAAGSATDVIRRWWGRTRM